MLSGVAMVPECLEVAGGTRLNFISLAMESKLATTFPILDCRSLVAPCQQSRCPGLPRVYTPDCE